MEHSRVLPMCFIAWSEPQIILGFISTLISGKLRYITRYD